MSFDFINEFNRKMSTIDNDWKVTALISPNEICYSLGSDSKLIGRIFELIITNVLRDLAKEHELILKLSDQQTVYPDFTLMVDEHDTNKIAIDVKTTYRKFNRKNELKKFGFTLGSFASFMRNNTKNIVYPYDQYSKHYIIGFLYTRNTDAEEGLSYDVSELQKIELPYKDVEYFVQEKHKIAGEKPGSGNTENIGSFLTNNIDHLKDGLGPFAALGEDIYNLYWKNYPKYRSNDTHYRNIDEFLIWYEENQEMDATVLKQRFEDWKASFGGSLFADQSGEIED